ncbi:xanthan lyase [Alistipes sp.]|uniref:golvesin C-terminal-like domain-containing protein n=1 Tax=Alistipes sp. TaxID=1872444 RepID=UPI0025BC1A93|nr:xanthan lyase [Alistipes sp.]
MNRTLHTAALAALLSLAAPASAQTLPDEVVRDIESLLSREARKETIFDGVRIDSVAVGARQISLFASQDCSYIPFREENVASLYREIRSLLPSRYDKYRLEVIAEGQPIEELVPLALRSRVNRRIRTFETSCRTPLVTPLDRINRPTRGLQNRHIAMWQSHGWYFEQSLNRWEWQRARILQTVEDLYTQSYVLPYLVPMLENAGANILLPRERDFNRHEVIVDNDGCLDNSRYTEQNGAQSWSEGASEGFAHLRRTYREFENPFREGTFRQVETRRDKEGATATWTPAIPAAGEYAVYVSYHSLPRSTEDALYTVHHKGGVSRFKVNQTMGGGTWIYLGTFPFDEGLDAGQCIVLSNRSSKNGRIVTADGVKIGGGMGNIARSITAEYLARNSKDSLADFAAEAARHVPQISRYPRFCEAARYWMQWAGVPDSVYSPHSGGNDYADDYKSRGLWVNYLAGGSEVLPDRQGLHIPVDAAFAFHSDAGTSRNDSIVGTLGIYMSRSEGRDTYANGSSRYMARQLTDLILSHVVNDVRRLYEPEWNRRGMWNKPYFEARTPQVPTMLLELLSHQNFADMRYGLDPRFRFTVSRAIYKGMLQFIASQNRVPYVVQPLPVDHMSATLSAEGRALVSWRPVDDPLEPSATPDRYIVYTRIGDGTFDNGRLVTSPRFETDIPAGEVCSFRVTALNDGGESFPSEILSVGIAANGVKKPVLIINGFDRIGAPADFVAPAPADTLLAGFLDDRDHGVPYVKDVSYVGKMKEFRRNIDWMDDDAAGFGDSYGDYETMVIAGNTFDYPALHGRAMLQAGYSFVSCSDEAVESGAVCMNDYPSVDLILGKECQTKMGRGGIHPLQFKTFSPEMQAAIGDYCRKGGNVMVSGAYVGTDLWDNPLTPRIKEDCAFATDVLKYFRRVGQAARRGGVRAVVSRLLPADGSFDYYATLNEESYVVESPDAIEPATPGAETVMRYTENNLSAAVAYRGDYKTFVMGYPFESIRSEEQRSLLMKRILDFFNDKNNRTTTH